MTDLEVSATDFSMEKNFYGPLRKPADICEEIVIDQMRRTLFLADDTCGSFKRHIWRSIVLELVTNIN